MDKIQKQYIDLLSSQQFHEEELDYTHLDRHIAALSSSAIFAGSALSIFDLYRCEHVYESTFHQSLFRDQQGKYTGVQIHPDDLVQVMKNGHQCPYGQYTQATDSQKIKSGQLNRGNQICSDSRFF